MVRAFGLHRLLALAILALGIHGAAPAMGATLHEHVASVAMMSDGSGATANDDCCGGAASHAELTCCAACHCNTVLGAEPTALEPSSRLVVAASAGTIYSGISIPPPLSPPRRGA